MLNDWREGPVVCVIGALGNPTLEQVDLFWFQSWPRLGGRHHFVFIVTGDTCEQLALGNVARFDHLRPITLSNDIGTLVKSEFALATLFIHTVTGQAAA